MLFCVSVPDEEVADTLSGSYVECSVKQMLPLERMASPVSVMYLKELEDRGIDSPKELSAVVPNLHVPDYGSSMTSSIYLRGFGSRMENPVLGLYIDDIPVLNKNAYDLDMLDIRRADLFRGPQGTVYGRNSMCGVLALSTLSPSSYSGVRAALEYGSANSVTARVSAYGRAKGGLAIGGGVSYRHSDGFYENEYTARVAVGNGEDVEVVYRINVCTEIVGTSLYHLGEQRAVYNAVGWQMSAIPVFCLPQILILHFCNLSTYLCWSSL